MQKRRALVVLALIALMMYPLAYERLQTFSHPLLLWDDAARLEEGKNNLPGLVRIYYNRGHELEKAGLHDMAVADYTRALQEKSAYYREHLLSDRGASYMALKRYQEALSDYDEAIALKHDDARPFMGRGLALEALGQPNAALPSFRMACQLGWHAACKRL